MDTIERLEKWNYGHKARCVKIDIDNGYGATCWSVKLWHEFGITSCDECSFFSSTNGWKYHVDESRKMGHVFAVESEDFDDWPGLDKTINAAIDAFEAGIYRKKENV